MVLSTETQKAVQEAVKTLVVINGFYHRLDEEIEYEVWLPKVTAVAAMTEEEIYSEVCLRDKIFNKIQGIALNELDLVWTSEWSNEMLEAFSEVYNLNNNNPWAYIGPKTSSKLMTKAIQLQDYVALTSFLWALCPYGEGEYMYETHMPEKVEEVENTLSAFTLGQLVAEKYSEEELQSKFGYSIDDLAEDLEWQLLPFSEEEKVSYSLLKKYGRVLIKTLEGSYEDFLDEVLEVMK